MPMLDHFNPPLSRTHPWRSFHSAWAAAMARLLNDGMLPPSHYAVPTADRDGPPGNRCRHTEKEYGEAVASNGATAPPTWTPPAPNIAVAVEVPPLDTVEVQVFADDGDPRLTAAVELVSPRNIVRPQARQAFAVKCVGYLQPGSSVVIVDTGTTRRAELHATILHLPGADTDPAALTPGLSAVSYRAVGRDEPAQQLEIWPAPLALGQPLPQLPLWIAADFAVPLDLEATYQTACRDLRIRQAG